MFLRYDIIMLIFLLLIPGCDLLVGLDVMDYWFIFAEFVHVRRCSVRLYSGFPNSFHKHLNVWIHPWAWLYKNHALFLVVSSLCLLLYSLLVVGMRSSMARLSKLGKWLCERITCYAPISFFSFTHHGYSSMITPSSAKYISPYPSFTFPVPITLPSL